MASALILNIPLFLICNQPFVVQISHTSFLFTSPFWRNKLLSSLWLWGTKWQTCLRNYLSKSTCISPPSLAVVWQVQNVRVRSHIPPVSWRQCSSRNVIRVALEGDQCNLILILGDNMFWVVLLSLTTFRWWVSLRLSSHAPDHWFIYFVSVSFSSILKFLFFSLIILLPPI